jgi:hypothetical protein
MVRAFASQLGFHHSTTMPLFCHMIIGPQMNTDSTDRI